MTRLWLQHIIMFHWKLLCQAHSKPLQKIFFLEMSYKDKMHVGRRINNALDNTNLICNSITVLGGKTNTSFKDMKEQ